VNNRAIEIGVGVFVALGIAALFMLAMQVSNLGTIGGSDGDSYRISATFSNVGGLKVRAPVTVSGVRVGRIDAIDYDLQAYEAVVIMRIDSAYDRFPEDTTASIFTSGLLGEQYIALEPGGAMKNLIDGSRIQLTQSALVLEQIIGQFLYSMSSSEPKQ